MSLLKNLRDKAVEKFVRNNELVKRFGEVEAISIDSETGVVDVSIQLHGEQAPLKFKGYYFFDETSTDSSRGSVDIIVRKITCERLWINEALDYWLSSNTLRYTIPGIAGGIAKFFF
ncbi:MAG: hypothetical protein HUK20_08080 [Fibrobacter sp.]|nr:hypothetical protein [Fibrobacter sp.]